MNELARLNIAYPMMFMVSNPQMGKKSYCGVLEFSAEEGVCHLPIWMMNNLLVQEGSEIILRNVNLKKGSFIVIQPHETAFIDLSNPKAILEQELTNYTTLHKGDTININYGGRDYAIDIVETKPQDQICVVDTNIEVDFKQPLDYVEKPRAQQQMEKYEEQKNQQKMKEIDEKFVRLDGKAITKKQKDHLIQKMEENVKREEDFDPRKHRLKHGIRNYDRSAF